MKRRAFLALPLLALASTAEAAKFGPWYGDEAPGTIVIITSDHTLHYVNEYGSRISYPIAVGKEGVQWTGVTTVTHKRKHPDWRPTPSMRAKDPSLSAIVKAGPHNPLGTRAIYLAEGYLRIHGTNSPRSIGKNASSGCYRMYNEDVEELFELVSPGAEVIVLP